MSAQHVAGTTSRFDRPSRRWRRLIALATLLGLPAMFVWSSYWMTTSAPTILWGPISFVLIGVTVVGSFLLYRYVRHRADMPGPGLDERERQLRDRAWILSYQVLSAVVLGVVIVLGILVLGVGRPVTLDAGLVNAMVLCVAVLLPVLPSAALAWIEPDAPAEL